MLFTALTLGVLGSFHCVGMCGAIALALPIGSPSFYTILLNRLIYNIGRVIAYTFLGIFVGLAGRGLALGISQQWLSVAVGVLMLVLILTPTSLSRRWGILRLFTPVTQYLKEQFSYLFKQKTAYSFLWIGILNGFLPCGLVYLALAGALAMGSISEAMLYMALFGLATIPTMLALSMLGKWLPIQAKQKIYRLVPVFTFMLAILFILRGLNLGIPYLSPQLVENQQRTEMNCCK
jgi:sulfite exporter TauE/SafE